MDIPCLRLCTRFSVSMRVPKKQVLINMRINMHIHTYAGVGYVKITAKEIDVDRRVSLSMCRCMDLSMHQFASLCAHTYAHVR